MATHVCPCGNAGDPDLYCRCTEEQKRRYLSRLSGPLLDRIDLQVGVPRVTPESLRTYEKGESSEVVRERVERAVSRQQARQQLLNAELGSSELEQVCQLSASAEKMLLDASTRLMLSLRGHYRVLKVARTIADLAGEEAILPQHVIEAVAYRQQLLLS